HGSAPDIAVKGVANPTATMLTAAMMLDHLGFREEAARIEEPIDRALADGPVPRAHGGDATTAQFTDAVLAAYTSPRCTRWRATGAPSGPTGWRASPRSPR